MAQDSPQDSNEFQRALFEALAKLQKGEAAQPSVEFTFDQLQKILEQQQSLKDDVSQQLELFKDLSDLLPGFIWTASADGQIDYINKRWYEWSGSSEAESLGEGWLTHVFSEDIELLRSRWRQSIATGSPFESPLLNVTVSPFPSNVWIRFPDIKYEPVFAGGLLMRLISFPVILPEA